MTWADEKAILLLQKMNKNVGKGVVVLKFPPNRLEINNRIIVYRNGRILKWPSPSSKPSTWRLVKSKRMRNAIIMSLWPGWFPDDMG